MTTELATSDFAAPILEGQARTGIRQRLRAATHAHHVRLDHHPLLSGITKPGYPMATYQQVLLGYFHLYDTLEAGITACSASQCMDFDYQARLKLPWIKADLACFGLDAMAAEQGPRHAMAPFVINNPAQLAGTLYAIEGSTLGGRVIARHVAKNQGLTSSNGARFFNGYGEDTAERWSEFEGFLQRSCVDESSQHQACGAAVTAFLLVERTLNESHEKLCATT